MLNYKIFNSLRTPKTTPFSRTVLKMFKHKFKNSSRTQDNTIFKKSSLNSSLILQTNVRTAQEHHVQEKVLKML